MDLPDPVPLGVSGTLSVPRSHYEAASARKGRIDVLCDDRTRIAYLVHRLEDAFNRPLTFPGSGAIARAMLGLFPEPEVAVTAFAEKALQTLRDGARHDRIALPQGSLPIAVCFVSWNGTHREVQPLRYGTYFEALAGVAMRVVDRHGPLAGFLEIDAFVREDIDPQDPARPLAETLEIDVEFSFLPGFVLRYPEEAPSPLPKLVMLNKDLCAVEELQKLANAKH